MFIFQKNGEKSQSINLQKMLILNPCASRELQEVRHTSRKKRRDETAGKEDQYQAEAKSLAEQSEDNKS